MEVWIEPSDSEKKKFGDLDSAVEYVQHRPSENFTVQWGDDVVESMKDQFRARVYQATGKLFTPTDATASEKADIRRRIKQILEE